MKIWFGSNERMKSKRKTKWLTFSTLNQQSWPRLVWELSIISSSTRKNAWSCRNFNGKGLRLQSIRKQSIFNINGQINKVARLEQKTELNCLPIQCTNQGHMLGTLHCRSVRFLLAAYSYQSQRSHDSAYLAATTPIKPRTV